MPASAASPRRGYRERHGRGLRSSATGPALPMLRTRLDFFDASVADAAEHCREIWPEELAGVAFEVAGMPADDAGADGLDRWRVSRRQRRIVLYRVPIERLAHLHRDDEWHRRSYIESCVFRAVAELLGKDPWDISPERFRHF